MLARPKLSQRLGRRTMRTLLFASSTAVLAAITSACSTTGPSDSVTGNYHLLHIDGRLPGVVMEGNLSGIPWRIEITSASLELRADRTYGLEFLGRQVVNGATAQTIGDNGGGSYTVIDNVLELTSRDGRFDGHFDHGILNLMDEYGNVWAFQRQ